MTHRCGRCDNTWTGMRICHCGSCHETFSTLPNFDTHRKNGECKSPARTGLVQKSGVWRKAGEFYNFEKGED